MLSNSVINSVNKENIAHILLQVLYVDYLYQDEQAVLRGLNFLISKTLSLCFEKCSANLLASFVLFAI